MLRWSITPPALRTVVAPMEYSAVSSPEYFSGDLADPILDFAFPSADLPPPNIRISAFAPYPGAVASTTPTSCSKWARPKNIHSRAMEMLRRIPPPAVGIRKKRGCCSGSDGGFRHMMRERQRREKLSQSYADLHAILPRCSKSDKNSIVNSAYVRVREMRKVEEELQRRKEELKERAMAARGSPATEEAKIAIRVADPAAAAMDAMIAALRCMKANPDVKVLKIQAGSEPGREVWACITIETHQVSRLLQNRTCFT